MTTREPGPGTASAFRERAKRILDSEIANREDLATIGTTMNVFAALDSPGMWRIERGRPPESEIVVGATLLRPLIVEDEDIHLSKIVQSVGYLTRNCADDVRHHVQVCCAAWKAWPKGVRWSLAVANGADSMAMRTDRRIAMDWLYGDVVHADRTRQHNIRLVSEDDRLLAGLAWVKDGIYLTRARSC